MLAEHGDSPPLSTGHTDEGGEQDTTKMRGQFDDDDGDDDEQERLQAECLLKQKAVLGLILSFQNVFLGVGETSRFLGAEG